VPTANVALRRRRSPVLGIFAVKVFVSGRAFLGVANVGVRPTINKIAKPQLETHLFDFNDDLYGQRIKVEFCKKLRDEQKFDSVEILKQQIQRDIQAAKDFFTTTLSR
jgi:riboflavin kinase/FMN adenylyltransferase